MNLRTTSLSFAALLLAALPASAQLFLYSAGHADLGLGEENELEPHIHVEEGAIVNGVLATDLGIDELEADEVAIAVADATFDAVNSGGGRANGDIWDLVGVAAGESFWFLPQDSATAEALNVPWLGIGAEEIDTGVWDNNSVSLALTGIVSAPADGVFSIWQAPTFGDPTFFMSTADAIDGADVFTLSNIASIDHDHVAWGFSQPGIYEITFAAQAFSNGQLFEEEATFTFAVGDDAIAAIPEPSTIGLLIVGLAGLVFVGLRRRIRG